MNAEKKEGRGERKNGLIEALENSRHRGAGRGRKRR